MAAALSRATILICWSVSPLALSPPTMAFMPSM